MSGDPRSLQFSAAHTTFLENVGPHLTSGEFLELSLLHPDTGQVIVSTDPAEEGKFREDRLYFLNGKAGPYVQNPYYSLAAQAIAMNAAAPIYAPDGRLLAVLAGQIDLRDLNAIIGGWARLHESADAYLVNTSSLFVTQPRFIQDPAVLLRGNQTEHVKRCLRRESGALDTLDYRGKPVLVVYHWLPERGLCLVVKMDQGEALRPVREFGAAIAVISLLELLLAALIGLGLARGLTRPIQALQQGAARFGSGELDTRLPDTSRDELGQLAAEFNRMAEGLSRQQTHLRRRAEQFFSLAPDLLCTISPAGRLVDVNPAWDQVLGYRPEELRGHPLADLAHPEDLPALRTALQHTAGDTVGSRFEGRVRHHDGGYRWLAWALIVSPQDPLLYAAARDITDRREAEETLRRQAEELERSNRELEQFAYVASHDLQEPLRIITSYVQLLARRYQGRLDPDADEFIGFAVEGANQMKSLITDLLAYSRVGSRGRDLAPVEMEAVLARVLEQMQLALEESDGTVTHDPLPAVLGDEVQMMQLLQNLIGNALKFHGSKPPRIHVGARREEGHWLFFVRDNGIGIEPQHAERVFVIFQRLHGRKDYPGTGMGLAICRKIVERHGGRIWLESEPGRGTTFYFTLQPAESGGPGAAPQQPRDAVADRARDLI